MNFLIYCQCYFFAFTLDKEKSKKGDTGDMSGGRILCCLSGQIDFCPSGDRCSRAPVSSRSERWFLFQLRPCPHADGTISPKFVFEAPEQVPQGASIRMLTLRVFFQAIKPGDWFREDIVFKSPPLWAPSPPLPPNAWMLHSSSCSRRARVSRAAVEERPPPILASGVYNLR